MTVSVALTGNVASGKTRVAEIWRGAGTPVVLADDPWAAQVSMDLQSPAEAPRQRDSP